MYLTEIHIGATTIKSKRECTDAPESMHAFLSSRKLFREAGKTRKSRIGTSCVCQDRGFIKVFAPASGGSARRFPIPFLHVQ